MIPTTVVTLAFALTVVPAVELPTKFWQIAPKFDEAELFKIKPERDTAVILLHGLMPRPFRTDLAEHPEPHSWQKPTGDLVKLLSADADIFGFSYAQTLPVDAIALSRGLQSGIAMIKAASYKQIVLVGHSAGGIIARRFVELYPDSGVTKLICVACPHLGSDWAELPQVVLPKVQVRFIQSLLPEYREQRAKEWSHSLNRDVQVCCVICKLSRLGSDTVVPVASQWPDQLQQQGVPAVLVGCTHFEAMKSEKSLKAISDLVKGKVTRWAPEQVEQARTALFGAKEKR
jgi:pimeloyl-ACP methyl ester carboxylesterase